MRNAISVDLEDWYHICGLDNRQWENEWGKYSGRLTANVEKILVLLGQYRVKATFFVVGYIADKDPALIRRIADAGHELASHGYYHRRIFDMTPAEFEEDLLRSKRAIESASGRKVLGYRAPEWSLKSKCAWALDVLVKNGFEYDASSNPISHLSGKAFGLSPSRLKTEHGEIDEFPLPTFRIFGERIPFSGGLPLRVTPHCFVVRFTRMLNREGLPVMLYIHPWEFDKTQVKIDLPLNRRVMHYFNRRVIPTKVEHLLKHFNFAPVSEVLESIKSGAIAQDPAPEWRPDGVYIKSCFFSALGLGALYIAIFLSPLLLGWYALSLIFIGLTIIYWPWTMISNFFESFKK